MQTRKAQARMILPLVAGMAIGALFGEASRMFKKRNALKPETTSVVPDRPIEVRKNAKIVRPAKWDDAGHIRLGTRDPKELSDALRKGGFIEQVGCGGFTHNADIAEMVRRAPKHQRRQTVRIVTTSAYGLGFDGTPTLEQIYARARSAGLELLPAEAGPKYRLKYPDSFKCSGRVIASQPIKDAKDTPSLFFVRNDELTTIATDNEFLGQQAMFIFALKQ